MLEQIQKYPQKEEYQKLVEADRINLYEREAGGRIVAAGTPEQVAKNPDSVTGRFL